MSHCMFALVMCTQIPNCNCSQAGCQTKVPSGDRPTLTITLTLTLNLILTLTLTLNWPPVGPVVFLQNHSRFSPGPIRSLQPFHSRAYSLPVAKIPIGPWPIHSQELSLAGTFAPGTFTPGNECSRDFCPVELSSSSSSTNFSATQVYKKTSGPLCVTYQSALLWLYHTLLIL